MTTYDDLLEKLTILKKFRMKILKEIQTDLKDMSITDFMVLNKICSEIRDLTMTNLSELTGFSNTLITFSVDNLESKGLVYRIKGNDRRTYFIKLTEKGLEKFKDIESDKKRRITSFFETMSKEDYEKFLALLTQLNDIVEKYG